MESDGQGNNGKTKCPSNPVVHGGQTCRHMQRIHKWSDSGAKHVESLHNLGKQYTFKKQCPAKKDKIFTIIKPVHIMVVDL